MSAITPIRIASSLTPVRIGAAVGSGTTVSSAGGVGVGVARSGDDTTGPWRLGVLQPATTKASATVNASGAVASLKKRASRTPLSSHVADAARAAGSGPGSGEALLQVGDDVVHRLEANRQPHQSGIHTGADLLFFGEL